MRAFFNNQGLTTFTAHTLLLLKTNPSDVLPKNLRGETKHSKNYAMDIQ